MPKRTILLLTIFLLLLSMACVVGARTTSPMAMTLTPLSAAVAGTATAKAKDVGGAGDKLATAVAKATAQSADIFAAETARASLNDASKLATATIIAPAVAELSFYGLDQTPGYVAWVHKPATIDLNGYQQSGYANDYPQITAKDFAMAADIAMSTYNSLSACGFIFRSNGNSNKPSQYMVVITRYATGYLGFTATVDGEMSNMRTIYLAAQDKNFNWQNNATNRLAVVVRGKMIDAYTNRVLVGEIDTTQPPPDDQQTPPKLVLPKNATPEQKQDYQNQIDQNQQNNDFLNSQISTSRTNFAKNKPIFTEGMLGFVGVSQSGHTTCSFSNAWLYIIQD
ncbi:MAG: hypothetical protein ABSF99_05310 [Anaerolineales bacterium]